MITKCKYCGYEGETHYYKRKNHCMKCNRLVGKDLEKYENEVKE
jgi:predicted Zn-ribbon and HTH transcriptional regulator